MQNEQSNQNHHHIQQQPVIQSESNNWRNILSSIGVFLLAPLVAVFLVLFVFQSYQVDGESMENTLQNNDKLIIYKLPRTWASITHHSYVPKRYDVIVFTKHQEDGLGRGTSRKLIKRVIGLPGDHVVVKDGRVTVYNDQSPTGFNPDKGQSWSKFSPITDREVDITVGENQVFVLGDNRLNSQDSRYFGPVDLSDISGRLILRIFPLKGFDSY